MFQFQHLHFPVYPHRIIIYILKSAKYVRRKIRMCEEKNLDIWGFYSAEYTKVHLVILFDLSASIGDLEELWGMFTQYFYCLAKVLFTCNCSFYMEF